jgi:hypothetical protein
MRNFHLNETGKTTIQRIIFHNMNPCFYLLDPIRQVGNSVMSNYMLCRIASLENETKCNVITRNVSVERSLAKQP